MILQDVADTGRVTAGPNLFWVAPLARDEFTPRPKPTSLVSALQKVLPACKNKLSAMSMRVPTSIVSASDMVLSLDKRISIKMIEEIFQQLENNYPDVVKINKDSLVSIDYKGIKQSCVIDLQWLEIINNKIKLVLWYDNEWGYSNRVIDLVKIIHEKLI